MNFISIDKGNLDLLQAAWAKMSDAVMEELTIAMNEAAPMLEKYVKDLTPTSTPAGAGGGGASGLKGGIYSASETLGDRVLGMVATSRTYAEPVELGTRPHFPPIEPLVDWVRVKFGIEDDKEAEQRARAVAWGIYHHGTPGHGMFHRALANHESEVREIFDRAMERIVARMAGKS